MTRYININSDFIPRDPHTTQRLIASRLPHSFQPGDGLMLNDASTTDTL